MIWEVWRVSGLELLLVLDLHEMETWHNKLDTKVIWEYMYLSMLNKSLPQPRKAGKFWGLNIVQGTSFTQRIFLLHDISTKLDQRD